MPTIYIYTGDLPLAPVLAEALGDKAGDVAVRRPESLAWRVLLRQALAEHDLPTDLGRLTVSPSGRPLLPGLGIDFSPTHTHGLVALAFDATGNRIGLDAEVARGRDVSRLLRAAARWFTPQELEHVRQAYPLGNAATEQAFLRVWTAKEALVKRTGAGLQGMRQADSFCPDGCVLRLVPVELATVTVALAPEAAGAQIVVKQLAPGAWLS